MNRNNNEKPRPRYGEYVFSEEEEEDEYVRRQMEKQAAASQILKEYGIDAARYTDRGNQPQPQSYYPGEPDVPSRVRPKEQDTSDGECTAAVFKGLLGNLNKKKLTGASVALVLMLIVNIAAVVYFGTLGKMHIFSSDDVESSRVSGDERNALDDEFASSDSDTAEGLPDNADYVMSTDDVSIMLLVGSDSRFGIDKEAHSDSMMLVAIDRTHKKIKITSIMRDLYAVIPGYKNHRFNQAFYYDSKYKNLDLKITFKTIEQNLGISAKDYVVIDFSGFKNVIDKLGGITMDLTDAEAKYMCSDKDYGKFPRFSAGAGRYVLSGAEALNYARMRHEDGNSGDFGRTQRQRKMITQMAAQLKDADVSTLYSVATDCLQYISTNISVEQINGYVLEAANLLSFDIVQMRIPIEDTYVQSRVYDDLTPMSVLWPNYKWNAERLKEFIFDDSLTYANGGRPEKHVTVPYLPAGTIKTYEDAVAAHKKKK